MNQAHKKIVIIGGSAAGPKAAAKARRIDENADITIIQREAGLSMASCGFPYYVGGFFDDRNQLISTPAGAVRDPAFFENAKAITALTQTEATAIDRHARTVACKKLLSGEEFRIPYDTLIIATGASPRIPPVPGTQLRGISTLQSLGDADYLRSVRDEGKVRRAVVIGGGLIGIETCEALELAGIEITLVEMMPQMLAFLDWEMARLVENYVRARGVKVITENGVSAFLGEDGALNAVRLAGGEEIPCDLAVIAIGVQPNARLAQEAGLAIGLTGGIEVNEYMQTSDPAIYAAGDCIEIRHLVSGQKVHAPLGDLANLEGRAAGENAILGNAVKFPGVLQTSICKVFDFAAGSTGLSEGAARKAGFGDIVTVINASTDKPGYIGGKLLVTKAIVNRGDGRVLGAQCVGPGDVSRQIAQWAMTLTGKLCVEDLVNADLPYAPPFSLAIDHFIATAHLLQNKLKGRLKGISALELKDKIDRNEPPFLVDCRSPAEYESMRLGAGEILIPIGALRKRLAELPPDKNAEIVAYCKISLRGYEAALVLESNGYTNVRVLEGGLMAWPYGREK